MAIAFLRTSSLLRSSSFYSLPPRVTGIFLKASPRSIGRPMSASMSSLVDVPEMKLLHSVHDNYGGVIVEMNESMESGAFSRILQNSLSNWRQQGKKGVWIKLPIHLISLAEAAVKEGFWFHHAEPNYLMLVHWIPIDANTLPTNASHRVGVGAFVMNTKGEVLVVQEKIGRHQGQGIWKFPTGVVNEGEDINAAVVREVKEETGIDAEFIEVLAFRQSHKSFFEKSDLFFVCILRPLSFDIHPQESEIEAAQWMPWEEYKKEPFVQKHELLRYIVEVCSAKTEGKYSGLAPVSVGGPDQRAFFYFNNQNLLGNL